MRAEPDPGRRRRAALTSAPAHVDTLYRAFAKTLLVLARRRGLSEIKLQEVAGVIDAGAAE